MADQPKPADQTNKEYYAGLRSLFDMASSELQTRITHEQLGFDAMDRLYRTHIEPTKWPFSSRIAIPIAWTKLVAKATRLLANKLAGKLTPTDEGQELGAMVGTELLHAQWDDIDFHDDEPMLMRWFRMDQNARKYGKAFAYSPWRKEKNFDGPNFVPWDNREVFTLTGENDVNDGVFLGSWPTIHKLYKTSDISGDKLGMYDAATLKKLEEMVGDSNDKVSVNRSIKGLSSVETDSSAGVSPRYKRIHLIQFRSPERWVDFVPTKGGEGDDPMLVLRDIPNPHKHGRTNVVCLNYYPIDDDQYGVSELEASRSMLKAMWALVCNYMDDVNLSLFPITKGHPTNVQWNTVEYKARAHWIMNNPATDLIPLEKGNSNLQKFTEVYKLLAGAINEALGESTAEASSMNATAGDKTATEIKDTALLRSARDNFNKLALSAAMARMVWFWWQDDRQFLTNEKVIRITGKEAIEYFTQEGLHDYDLSEEGYEAIGQYMQDHMGVDFPTAYDALRELGELDQYAIPMHGAGTDGMKPKLALDRSGKTGFLTIDPQKDMSGSYRYIPDIEAVSMPNDAQDATNLMSMIGQLTNPQVSAQLQTQGDMVKVKDLFVRAMAKLKIQDGDQYFTSAGKQPDGGTMGGEQPAVPGAPQPPAPDMGGMANLMQQPVTQPNVPQIPGATAA